VATTAPSIGGHPRRGATLQSSDGIWLNQPGSYTPPGNGWAGTVGSPSAAHRPLATSRRCRTSDTACASSSPPRTLLGLPPRPPRSRR